MKIKKAVITAAGRAQHTLPLQTLIDRDGEAKSALQIIVEEALSAEVHDVCVVIRPGDEETYRNAAGSHAEVLRFVEQKEARGYGHALWCAREFVGDDSFLHLVSDHLYLSQRVETCAQQLVDAAVGNSCSVSAVQPTREAMLSYYGVVGGRGAPEKPFLYEVERVLEKPTPTEAEQHALSPGLRAGHFLCFFGMHVLTPAVMAILEDQMRGAAENQTFQLSPALAELAGREKYLARVIEGSRYNLGVRFGVFNAQLALAMSGRDREDVLAQMLEIISSRQRQPNDRIAEPAS